jgi:hypothetical protein
MRTIVVTLLASLALMVPGASRANVCSVPGNTVAWATDQCLKETGESDPNSKAVVACLSRANPIPQPCEWNAIYKQAYCRVLVTRGEFAGKMEECVKDPSILGPTVRRSMQDAE